MFETTNQYVYIYIMQIFSDTLPVFSNVKIGNTPEMEGVFLAG